MIHITLRPGHDRRVRGGHPWIFSNEIEQVEGSFEGGVSAGIFSSRGTLLGTAYYNPHSLIAARILSRQKTNIDTPDFSWNVFPTP